MRAFILLLCLLSSQAWAANWFVRPGSSFGGTNAGTSYANAWKDWSSVAWASVSAGDTIYSCGYFNAGSGATQYINVAKDGAAGAPITVNGDCSSQGDLSRSVWDGNNVRVVGFSTSTFTYITVKNMEVKNFTTRGFYIANNSSPDQTISRNVVIDGNYVHDIDGNAGASPNCIVVYGRDVSLLNNRIDGCGDDAVSVKGKRVTTKNNTITRVGLDTPTTADCIAYGGSSIEIDGFIISGNYCDHTTNDFKQCVVASLASDAPVGVIEKNTCLMPIGAVNMFGVFVDSGDPIIRGNYFSGGFDALNIGSTAGHLVQVYGNVVVQPTNDGIRASFSLANQVTNIDHNTVFNAGRYGINADCNGATCTVAVNNNVSVGAGNACLRGLSAIATHKNNDLYGCGTPYKVNTTVTTPDATTVIVEPAWIGGVAPTSADGFCLRSDSPLLGAGTYRGAYISGFGGEGLTNPPPIGARGLCRLRQPAAVRRLAGARAAN